MTAILTLAYDIEVLRRAWFLFGRNCRSQAIFDDVIKSESIFSFLSLSLVWSAYILCHISHLRICTIDKMETRLKSGGLFLNLFLYITMTIVQDNGVVRIGLE